MISAKAVVRHNVITATDNMELNPAAVSQTKT